MRITSIDFDAICKNGIKRTLPASAFDGILSRLRENQLA
jgi:hypothetical protein